LLLLKIKFSLIRVYYATVQGDYKKEYMMRLMRILLAALVVPAFMFAEGEYKVKGFGTLSAITIDKKNAVFMPYIDQISGAEKGRADFGSGSVLGGQFDYIWTDGLQFSTQNVIRKDVDDHYSPATQTLNIGYNFAQEYNVKVGRIGYPFFNYSDTLYMGYGMPYLRAPYDLYSIFTFTNYNGAQLTNRKMLGNYFVETKVGYGNTNQNIMVGVGKSPLELDKARIASVQFGDDKLTFRIAYMDALVTISNGKANDLFTALKNIPKYKYLADQNEVIGKKGTYLTVGSKYDDGVVFVEGEYGKRTTEGFFPNIEAFYIASGYRIDNFTPYIMCSGRFQKNKYSADAIQIVNQATGALASGLKYVLDRDYSQRTYSLGARYDFKDNMALKFQWDTSKPLKDDKNGVFLNKDGSNADGSNKIGSKMGTVNTFSLSLDFVF
jgi:hypothetical protein